MAISLTKPSAGSVGWAADVNQNFAIIEANLIPIGGITGLVRARPKITQSARGRGR